MGQLGETLRDRRLALGITLETAEEDTKIRGRLLEALEQGDYARLPDPGYVRGYVSSYSRYLELDPIQGPDHPAAHGEAAAGRFEPEHRPARVQASHWALTSIQGRQRRATR